MTKKIMKAEDDESSNGHKSPNLKAKKVEENKQIIEETHESSQSKENSPIVGIGASAGGLEAIEAFFFNAIPNSGIAWVVVMHLDPTRESILSELIKKYTQMPVYQIENNMEVKPDYVYVIPPNHDIALKGNKFLLSEPTASRGLRLPIDFFFRSLLKDQEERAIGVILSGTGTDGTFGARDIKGSGGMIIAQDPQTAKYDGMPRSVISSTVVDYILPPDKIPQQVIEYVQKHVSNRILKLEGPSKDDINYLNQIFQLISTRTGHDFSTYKINTLVRRIERRMMINQISIITEYIQKIRDDPKELRVLTQELIIGVTNFFRDKDAFQLLEDKIIPTLFQNRKSMDPPVRIWIPGCSTGEEAYSIAIIIQEYIEKVQKDIKFQIFATDIDDSAIETARLGFFPENISVDVSPERLQRYFIQEKNFYQIIKPIRDKIVFAVQNIIRDPPFSKLDFISCRNLFIYLIPEVQKKLLSIFEYSLNEGGILFLGSSESMGESNENFVIINQKWKLFQKKEIKKPYKELIRPFPPLIGSPAKTSVMDFSKGKEKLDYRKLIEGILIKEYAPASVVINHKNEIVYIYGHTGKFLEPSASEAKMVVTEMVRDDLKLELMNAIRKVTSEKMIYRREGLKVRSNSDSTYINLIVNPISEPPEMSDLILISFEEILSKEPKSDNTLIQEPLKNGSVKIIK